MKKTNTIKVNEKSYIFLILTFSLCCFSYVIIKTNKSIYFYMSMLSEIEKLMNTSETSIMYRVVNLGGHSLYIEGIKSVISFGTEKMSFQLKKATLEIVGKDLNIKYLDKETCILTGKIRSVAEI